MNVSEQIAHWLVAQGVKQAFTVTGGGAMFLNQAIGGSADMNCTFMHHEQACAMAAEGYARVTNKPAVVMLTTGPGAINALNGVFGAYTDSIPMIVISGQVKRETCLSFYDLPNLRQLGDQEGPTIELARNVCKYAKVVRSSEELINVLPEAYLQAISGRPGPVWLDIPLDIQSAKDVINIPNVYFEQKNVNDISNELDIVVEKLKAAKKPIILAGSGVRLSGSIEDLITFAEQHQIPVCTAWTHDLIDSQHPLFAGRPGTIGTRSGNFSLQNSDFVLVLGSRLNIRQTSYNWATFAKNAYVAQVDIDQNELSKPTYKPNLPVVSDVKIFIAALNKKLGSEKLPSYAKWVGWCQNISKTYHPRNEHKQKNERGLNPYLVVDRIFNNARNNDIFVCGNASACIIPFQIGSLKKDQRLFSNSGSASMGHDLPASIGAAVADRNKRVICFAGDGSLQMNIQELQTLKTLNLNMIVIVLNNKGYLSIRQTHENFFGRVIGANPESGVDFPDFCEVARAYGINAISIENLSDLNLLDKQLGEDGPCLIDIHVDSLQEFEPRIKSRVDENGKFVTPELDDMFPFLDPKIVEKIRQSAVEDTK